MERAKCIVVSKLYCSVYFFLSQPSWLLIPSDLLSLYALCLAANAVSSKLYLLLIHVLRRVQHNPPSNFIIFFHLYVAVLNTLLARYH